MNARSVAAAVVLWTAMAMPAVAQQPHRDEPKVGTTASQGKPKALDEFVVSDPQSKQRSDEAEREFNSAENQDPSASAALQSRILSEISRQATASKADIDAQVECRTGICRIQLAFPGQGAQARSAGGTTSARLIVSTAATLGLETRGMFAGSAHGTPVLIAYLAKSR